MTIIDQSTWPRKERYDFFSTMNHPYFTLTFPIEVTPLRRHAKANGFSFYHGMTYLVTQAMNQVEAFRYKIRGKDVILHDQLIPSFTFLKPDQDYFQIATVPLGESMEDFDRRAKEQCRTQTEFMFTGPWDTDQLAYITCLPWFPITALTNERNVEPDDSVPRLSWGKYEEREGKTFLSLSVELNHRLQDGGHVGAFYETLTGMIAALD